jgi:hypothetical protein
MFIAVNTEKRKPWPMGWIILAMVLFIAPYTFLTLHYRKPGPAYQPYQDAKEKTVLARTGFTRISLPASQPASGLLVPVTATSAQVSAHPGGLTPELNQALGAAVSLPVSIDSTAAPAVCESGKTYPFSFGCNISDLHHALASTRLYVKANQVFIITDFESLVGGLSARSTHTVIALELPAAALEAGSYTFTVVGRTTSISWKVLIK